MREISFAAQRRLGLTAAVTSVLGILYWPFHAVAYFQTEDGRESKGALPWDGAARDTLGPAIDWSDVDTVYVTYGKVTLVLLLGFLLGLLALHARQAQAGEKLERWGFRIALLGNAIAAVGAFVEYWLEQVDAGFAVGAPGVLLLLVGSTLFGVGTLRAEIAPRVGAWLLILSIPLLIAVTALLGHLSAGLVPLDVAWLVLGGWLWRSAPDAQGAGRSAVRYS